MESLESDYHTWEKMSTESLSQWWSITAEHGIRRIKRIFGQLILVTQQQIEVHTRKSNNKKTIQYDDFRTQKLAIGGTSIITSYKNSEVLRNSYISL